jgi:hypothetical protein
VVSKYIHRVCPFKLSLDEETLVVSVHILKRRLRQSEETHNIVHRYGCSYADWHELQNILWGYFNEGSCHHIVRFSSSCKKIQTVLEMWCHFANLLHTRARVCVRLCNYFSIMLHWRRVLAAHNTMLNNNTLHYICSKPTNALLEQISLV